MARVAGFVLLFVVLSVSPGAGADSASDFITVNGVSIRQDEYYSKLEQVKIQATRGGKSVLIPAGEYVVQQCITQLLLTQLAEKENVAPTAEQIDAKIAYAKRGNANIEAQLKAQGISIEEWRRQIGMQQALINLITKGIEVSEEDLKKDYDTRVNSGSFKMPEACNISVIACGDKARIDYVYKQLEAGKDFAKTARELSEDKTTAPDGGKVGWITSDMASVPEIVRITTFGTPEGKYSKPVFFQDKNDKTWAIIRVNEKRPAETQRFDEVKGLIREQLALKKANQKAFDKMVMDFVTTSDIKVSAERFKDIPAMIKRNATIDLSLTQPTGTAGAGN